MRPAKDLRDLAALRDALRARQRAEEEAERLRLEAAAAVERERMLFALSVGVVMPMRTPSTPPLPRARPEPLPRQRERDDRAVLAESIGAPFDAETLLETDDALSFRRPGVGVDVVRKLRRGTWAVQADVDLHGLRRDAARDRVREFLRDVTAAGLRCVRIVHGKGLGSPGREGVLKADMKHWLAQRAEVIAFTYATPPDGGHGALIVLLRSVAASA